MRDFMIEPVVDPVAEALRYAENAKKLLRENGKLDLETQLYQDRKYVRMAGNTLWNGMLLILEEVFHVKMNKSGRPDIIDYKQAINRRDKKLMSLVNAGYDLMHLAMGYDGNPSKSTCDDGFRVAEEIIKRCETLLR